MRQARTKWLVAAALLVAGTAARAAGTLTWAERPGELKFGRSEGMAVSERGRLFLAPRVSRFGATESPSMPAQVWAMTTDREGNLYLGTGPEGQILRVAPTGAQTIHFTVDEPLVTALAVTPDGDLLAGTAPEGLVYRIRGEGRGEVWGVTEDRYVWSLAVAPNGKVFAGTGERGRILEIHRSGSVEPLFDSDEAHIVSLLALDGGELLAGGAGRGLVYRIDREGHAMVLHDDGLPEVAALAAEPDGRVLAALVAPPTAKRRRPTLQLRLPDGVRVGSASENVGMLEEGSGPALRGTIEGLPSGEPAVAGHVRGRVVRIEPGGASRELWSSTREAPFCLTRDDAGGVLFGTGEPARLYRVDPEGDVARLATLDEAQITGLHRDGRATYLATSNPAAAYRIEDGAAGPGLYFSRPFDAGGPARWGSIRWSVENASGRTELYTRTGNSSDPDGTWSAWSPALTVADGSAIVNPDGRYLQWRVRQVGGSRDTRLHDVTVLYEPYNRPPRLEKFELVGSGRSFSGPITVRWSHADPDLDAVEVRLEYRPASSLEWSEAAVHRSPGGKGQGSAASSEARLVWATASLVEGDYEIRAVASDQPANPPGEGFESSEKPRLAVTVDRTPPELRVRRDGDVLEVRLVDAHSEIRRLELLREGRVRFTVRPQDGLCDSREEIFRVERPEADERGAWMLRGVDAAENAAERPLAAP